MFAIQARQRGATVRSLQTMRECATERAGDVPTGIPESCVHVSNEYLHDL